MHANRIPALTFGFSHNVKSGVLAIPQEILKEDWHSIRDGLEVKIVPWPKSDEDDASRTPTSNAETTPFDAKSNRPTAAAGFPCRKSAGCIIARFVTA